MTFKGLVRPVLEFAISEWDPPTTDIQDELTEVRNHAAMFVIGNYSYETWSMTSIF